MEAYIEYLNSEKEKLALLVSTKGEIVQEKNQRAEMFSTLAPLYTSSSPDNNKEIDVFDASLDANDALDDFDDDDEEEVLDEREREAKEDGVVDQEGRSVTFSHDDQQYEFLRDSDVEEYLKGLLWILTMYSTGKTPCISSYKRRYCH